MTEKFEKAVQVFNHPDRDDLEKVYRHSVFIADWLGKNPEYAARALDLAKTERDVDSILNDILTQDFHELDEEALLRHLRIIKMTEYTAIALKDLVYGADVRDITAHISAFASASLEAAYKYAYFRISRELGRPQDSEGSRIGMTVIGLGKLGGWELNFSSDIDIMYVYGTEVGRTDDSGDKPSVENHVFFSRVAEKITHYIGARTADGIVFRVDLRLRPDGDRGAIALPVRSCEIYYESYGQGWERMMLLKARPVAGDKRTGAEFLRAVRPFVFRRSLDYKLLDELKNIKQKIDRREEIRGNRNVKLGYGGIREIEFVVQAFQILYYPKYPEIYHPSTLEGIDLLVKFGQLEAETAERLKDEYRFLRKLEHMAQIENEKQTHVIPEDSAAFPLYLERCGFDDVDKFNEKFAETTRFVHSVFSGIFRDHEGADASSLIFDKELDQEEVARIIQDKGIRDAIRCASIIKEILHGRRNTIRTPEEIRIIEMVLTRVLEHLPERTDPAGTLLNFEKLLSHPTTVYLLQDIITGAPAILDKLENLFSFSRYMSDQIISDRTLLDYIYDPKDPDFKSSFIRLDYHERTKKYTGDTEYIMEIVRQRHKAYIFNAGYAFLNGTLNVIHTMKALTELAKGTIQFAVDAVYDQVTARYGRPVTADGRICDFLVVGMGKLGSYEMSFGSDLDIIFLYEENGRTDGKNSITNMEFFTKILQRAISFLSSYTTNGILYKIDTRLRPSGSSGTLVTALPAFREYQLKDAMTWEKQALARSSAVNTDSSLNDWFNEIKTECLFSSPLGKEGIKEIKEMRARIETEKGSPPEKNDIKAGYGGMLDIEFTVQMLQLLTGHEDQSVRNPNTHDVMVHLKNQGFIKERDYYALHDSYHFYRTLENVLRIYENTSTSRLPANEEILAKAGMFFCFEKNPAECLSEKYAWVRKSVRAAYNRVFERYM
ncbi:MAG: bifunctional [glutamate--ammonia ligase]-adenylyl-L-tyrosine phosphorylase/[glutamate--ammonia-ligase] adenylyltransferase [Geovibrio sp.]|nr:bifunctional [glutamate--ammonia ligase]-adenylyl-L-tyrosine phosphorylase/[glutamate--ammonia-ligase] adenylyltransferase [Geovibrio sp.]